MRSARKPPTAGQLHVWRVELTGEDDRARARAALAAILADYLGGAAEAAVSAAGNGKPRLVVEPNRLSFNLSHSGELALVAIAPGGVEVGVDIERLRPRRDLVRLAERWLPDADRAAVAAAGEAEREQVFYAAWTNHEARVKCTGAGLSGPPPGAALVARQLAIDAGYAAAVAVDLDAAGVIEPQVEIRPWGPGLGPDLVPVPS
jgi:phosphopantetheinyl transferase